MKTRYYFDGAHLFLDEQDDSHLIAILARIRAAAGDEAARLRATAHRLISGTSPDLVGL